MVRISALIAREAQSALTGDHVKRSAVLQLDLLEIVFIPEGREGGVHQAVKTN